MEKRFLACLRTFPTFTSSMNIFGITKSPKWKKMASKQKGEKGKSQITLFTKRFNISHFSWGTGDSMHCSHYKGVTSTPAALKTLLTIPMLNVSAPNGVAHAQYIGGHWKSKFSDYFFASFAAFEAFQRNDH